MSLSLSAVVAGPGPGAPRVADASVVLFDEGRGPTATAPRPGLLLDLGAGGLADGINSLQADGGTGERLLEHFVSIRGEGARAPPMWGLLSLSLETSSCVIYCVEIKIYDAFSWRCRFPTARPSQDGRVIAEK